jgi:molybdopterin-guanine dinucleotide biosynthesis protein A
MGQDKAGLAFGHETLLERMLRLVGAVTADIVVAAAPGQAVPAGVRVSRDPAGGEGPLPALLAAVDALDTSHVFLAACDAPLLQPALVPFLHGLCVGWDGAVPHLDGWLVPTCAVYQRSALQDARSRFGDPRHRSLRDFIALLRIQPVPVALIQTVDPTLSSFRPCNTPEEYRQALALAGLAVNGPPSPAV